jgi:hypothetical protein
MHSAQGGEMDADGGFLASLGMTSSLGFAAFFNDSIDGITRATDYGYG